MSKFRSVAHRASCAIVKSLCMINSHFPFVQSLLFFGSLLVGAELLSILDETENGFVWEHIQSYAEQAHGAWLGISAKGPATFHQTVSPWSSKPNDPFLDFFIQVYSS